MHKTACITLNSFPFDYAFLIEMNRKIAVTIDYVKKRKKKKTQKKNLVLEACGALKGLL